MNNATDSLAPDNQPVVPSVRVAVDRLVPDASSAMDELDSCSRRSTIAPGLLELVRTRVSQLNGCAYCVDMHGRDALAAGEAPRRVYALPVWQETPFFTARERAALKLAEAGTCLTSGPVPEAVYQAAAAEFSEPELAELIWVIAITNAWNRLGALARPWPLT